MAAKTWESDFRYEAICASVKELDGDHADDLFNFPGSFCAPVAKRPIVGWTPGRIFVISLVLGFLLMGAGVFMAGKAERDAKRGKAKNGLVLPIAASLSLAGVSLFFLPVLLDRFIMKVLVGSRGAKLRCRPGDLLCAEISDTDRSKMKVTIDGDDYILLLADYVHGRLLIEGIAARYMLRAADVTDLQPFEFMNYVGTEITFRINDETSLSLAIARVSLLLEITRQLPVLFFLRKLIKNRILAVCTQALRRTDEQLANLDDQARNG